MSSVKAGIRGTATAADGAGLSGPCARDAEAADAGESDRGIAVVDALLAGVGLEHGRRAVQRVQTEVATTAEPVSDAQTSVLVAHRAGDLQWLRVREWRTFPWLVHGFSTRRGGCTTVYKPGEESAASPGCGDLNLGFTASDTPENVVANRAAFLKALAAGSPEEAFDPRLMTLRQIHSGVTYVVADDGASGGDVLRAGDGLMTDVPGVMLGIQTADCIPVLLADRRRRVVAAFHAGWRGTLRRIVESGVGRMRLEFGSKPEDIVAAIGPGIGPCCYAVGEELRSEFESQFAYAGELFSEVYDSDPVKEKYPLLFMTARAPGHSDIGPGLHLDLIEANRRQLLDGGVRREAIAVAHACTSCDTERFFSYRAERGFCGRMMSVIGVRG